MKLNFVIVAAIAIHQIVYAEESSSNGGLSEVFFSEESSLDYSANDDATYEDQVNILNSEVKQISNLISDLKKEKDNVFENESNDVAENSVHDDQDFDIDDPKHHVELRVGRKTDPLDDELSDLEQVLGNVVRSVGGLLDALLNPVLGDKSTGRSGFLGNLIDKLRGVLDHADVLLNSQPRIPRRPKVSKEDGYEQDASELDFVHEEQNKEANIK